MMAPVPRLALVLAASVLFCMLASLVHAQPVPAPRPLFASAEPLELTLEAPFKRIDRERDKSQEYAGRLLHDDLTLDVKLSVRGNFRLRRKVCHHAPLWLDLKKKQVKNTLFDGQNRLKLVVQCKGSAIYQDYTTLEERAYRMFALLSPVSLRTRLVWVNYEDPDSGDSRRQLGFLIQHHKKLAEQFAYTIVEDNSVSKTALDDAQSSRVALFNYLIANTDYSMLGSPGEGSCCHNTKALRSEQGVVYPVPYDFDQTGYVGPRYAQVSEGLGQQNIRDRLYRGFCVKPEIFQQSVDAIVEQRSALLALADEEQWVSKGKRRSATRLLKEGLDVLADADALRSEVSRHCRR